MPQTIRHQRVMARLATAPTAEERASLARDFTARHPHHAIEEYEKARAERIHTELQADALRARVRAAGEAGCAELNEAPSVPLSEDFVISVLGVATLVLLAIFFAWGAPA